jgi:hypothetical protein
LGKWLDRFLAQEWRWAVDSVISEKEKKRYYIPSFYEGKGGFYTKKDILDHIESIENSENRAAVKSNFSQERLDKLKKDQERYAFFLKKQYKLAKHEEPSKLNEFVFGSKQSRPWKDLSPAEKDDIILGKIPSPKKDVSPSPARRELSPPRHLPSLAELEAMSSGDEGTPEFPRAREKSKSNLSPRNLSPARPKPAIQKSASPVRAIPTLAELEAMSDGEGGSDGDMLPFGLDDLDDFPNMFDDAPSMAGAEVSLPEWPGDLHRAPLPSKQSPKLKVAMSPEGSISPINRREVSPPESPSFNPWKDLMSESPRSNPWEHLIPAEKEAFRSESEQKAVKESLGAPRTITPPQSPKNSSSTTSSSVASSSQDIPSGPQPMDFVGGKWVPRDSLSKKTIKPRINQPEMTVVNGNLVPKEIPPFKPRKTHFTKAELDNLERENDRRDEGEERQQQPESEDSGISIEEAVQDYRNRLSSKGGLSRNDLDRYSEQYRDTVKYNPKLYGVSKQDYRDYLQNLGIYSKRAIDSQISEMYGRSIPESILRKEEGDKATRYLSESMGKMYDRQAAESRFLSEQNLLREKNAPMVFNKSMEAAFPAPKHTPVYASPSEAELLRANHQSILESPIYKSMLNSAPTYSSPQAHAEAFRDSVTTFAPRIEELRQKVEAATPEQINQVNLIQQERDTGNITPEQSNLIIGETLGVNPYVPGIMPYVPAPPKKISPIPQEENPYRDREMENRQNNSGQAQWGNLSPADRRFIQYQMQLNNLPYMHQDFAPNFAEQMNMPNVSPVILNEIMNQMQSQPTHYVPMRPRPSISQKIMSSFDPNMFSPEFVPEEGYGY